MPRDDMKERDERTLMPNWFQHEKHLAHMLPYVSLVDHRTVRTRVNELFQCVRITGVNSYTKDDEYLDKLRALFARIVAQLGEEFSYYIHKVSKGIQVDFEPAEGDNFAAVVDAQWRNKMETSGLRDKTLTLTVIHRPPTKSFLSFMRSPSPERLKDETAKRLRRLNEAVGIFTSGLTELKPSVLSAETGDLVGFLGALNTGQERPLYHTSQFGFLAFSAANTRVTFFGDHFELSEGVAGRRYGKSYSIKDYSEQTRCTMFDTLNLPVDMIVTHSFTPVNTNMTISRIKRQMKQMQAADDAAVSLRENLSFLADDLEAKRASMGDHHMVVTVFAETLEALETLGAEIVNAAASEGVTMVSDRFGANTHFFSQHPGNQSKRLRPSTITNRNFADFAAFHRTQLGKQGDEVPWGKVISLFPTPEKSAYRFSFHEAGSPEKEPTSGHTLIMGRPGSGKSVLAAFLMTQAKRAGARVFVFDYRQGMEMAVRANGGRYTTIQGGMPTGLNPLWTETDSRGIAWLADWFGSLLHREDKPLTPAQTNRIMECVRQNAQATDPSLRDWQNFASLFMSMDDDGDLNQRVLEWAEQGRFGWIFGHSLEDTFSLDGDMVGFDLTGILDSESDKERMAVLSYLFRRIERKIEDRKPTIIIIDEAWKALDNAYFAERLSQWLVTARKQNTVAMMMTQYASQLERTRTGKTIVEAVPTQVLLPNIRANASDYQMLNLYQKELDTLLNTGTNSRLALIRDDQGSVVVDANLSALGPNLTILGGMEAGEKLVGADYRDRSDFWRLQP